MLKMKKYLWLTFIVMPNLVHALSWQDLWLNKDQQGQKLLTNNNPKHAAETFQNHDWKGVAYYKDKQYDKAYAEFQHDSSATGLYNQGNALAYLGRYDEAIHSYEESLKVDSNNADAKHNIEVLKKLKQQKDQQNQQQDPSQSSQNKQSDSDKGDNKPDKSNQQSADDKNQANKNDSNKQNKSPSQADNNQNNSEQKNQNKPDDKSTHQNQSNANNQQSKSADQQNAQPNANTNKPAQNQQDSTAQEQSSQQNSQQQNKNKSNQGSNQYVNPKDLRQEQQMQAILSQIPDDPGGLLRNKFIRDYQNEQQGSGQ